MRVVFNLHLSLVQSSRHGIQYMNLGKSLLNVILKGLFKGVHTSSEDDCCIHVLLVNFLAGDYCWNQNAEIDRLLSVLASLFL